jgi:TRAP-type C4-dicarboxylate transport system substrate-binding protein
MQRGTLDGVSVPSYGYSAFKVDELSDWYSDDIKFGRLVTVSLVSKQAFDELPAQYQELLMNSIPVAQGALKDAYGGIEEVNFPKWKEMGIERVSFDPVAIKKMETENSESIYSDWIASANERGVPAKDLLDFLLSEASGN